MEDIFDIPWLFLTLFQELRVSVLKSTAPTKTSTSKTECQDTIKDKDYLKADNIFAY